MRVVADTNVLVSALVFPGDAPEAVYRFGLEGQIEVVASRPLLAELGRVLTEKFGWEPDRAEDAVAHLVRVAEIVDTEETITDIEADPGDNRVLEAAAEACVDAIISGDRHLLGLKSWRGIAMKSPATFQMDSTREAPPASNAQNLPRERLSSEASPPR